MPLTPMMFAPADEQSVVRPFFERSSPERRSSRCAAVVLLLAPSLSGRPMPLSQAAVTMRLPGGGGGQPGAWPTDVGGTGRSFLSSSAAARDPGLSDAGAR